VDHIVRLVLETNYFQDKEKIKQLSSSEIIRPAQDDTNNSVMVSLSNHNNPGVTLVRHLVDQSLPGY
jgi:hypothetical protein